MPNALFLQTFPLYKKFELEVPVRLQELSKPPVNLTCGMCQSHQTFRMANEYWQAGFEDGSAFCNGQVVRCRYRCTACNLFEHNFLLRFDKGATKEYSAPRYVEKVGQFPPWSINIDKQLAKMLQGHVETYKKGLICESQGYGIGAYAYYRRIVEDIIDKLLDGVAKLVPLEEKEKWLAAVEDTRKETNAQSKIRIVKDLLPASLRPNGENPLDILHGILSEGIHEKSDEECNELAGYVRDTLTYLVDQVLMAEESQNKFTESMKRLLEKRSERKAK